MMLLEIVLYCAGAGSCILIGGLIARISTFRPNWLENELRHFIIAFGGGILLGAIAVVLVPEGIESLDDSLISIPVFLAGGMAFFGVERWLGLQRRAYPQLIGMVLDYVPEAIALGGMMALGAPAAPLLALLMGLQNLPEGFNAYRELHEENHRSPRWTLLTMAALILLGPIAGLAGYLVLGSQPHILGSIMLFASGGILYLIFQDIAPQSRLDKHWAPPLGAVLGFCVSLFSDMLV